MYLYFGLNKRIVKDPVIYCGLHKVYLTLRDVRYKNCDGKKCKHRVTKCNWGKINEKING